MRQAVRTDSMPSSASALARNPAALQQSSTPQHCFLQQCERALAEVKPGQRVNCIPGIQSLAMKGRLIATLTEHYGEGAFELTPRSWLLPEQYWHWRLWAESQVHFCSCTLQTNNPCLLTPCSYTLQTNHPCVLTPCSYLLQTNNPCLPTPAAMRACTSGA